MADLDELTEDELKPRGVPVDFGGAVIPNPRGIKVSADTDSGVEPTGLPNGVTFQKPNFSGAMPADISNPPRAELIPGMEQPASAKIARPAPAQQAISLRGVKTDTPWSEELPPGVSVPPGTLNLPGQKPAIPSGPLQQKTEADQRTQQQLGKGSGIAQIGNPWARGALRGLNIAGEIGSAVMPQIGTVLRAIPGTEEHHQTLVAQNNKAITGDEAQAEKEAQTAHTAAETGAIPSTVAHTEAETEALKNPKVGLTPEETTIHDLMTGDNGKPRINPQTKQPYTYFEAYSAVKQAAQDVKPDKTVPAHISYDSGIPVTVTDGKGAVYDVNDPKLPAELKPLVQAATRAHGQHSQEDADKQARAFAHQRDVANTNVSRKDISAHDKAYVQPAEQVEKSYQMMDAAFREYEAARAQGKELPTGAQSMLALSTHLSTTFGQVKGSRVTKDMIQEHLGARSISDSALVAIQRLTNGDQLSPEQWKAFHDLIGNSRKLSWQTAAKEADRKKIPIDFLPADLQNMSHEPGAEGNARPATGTVQDGYKFKGGDPADQKNWEKVAK